MGRVTLETEHDRSIERKVVDRFVLQQYGPYGRAVNFPQFAFCDYLVTSMGQMMFAVEVKVRKQSPEELKQYGGLFLRWRKYEELCAFEKMSGVRAIVLFAFDNGEGQFLYCYPSLLENPTAIVPPPRRNGRNAVGDFEPVIELDWNNDLRHEL